LVQSFYECLHDVNTQLIAKKEHDNSFNQTSMGGCCATSCCVPSIANEVLVPNGNFTFRGTHLAKVVDVHDGDTVTVRLKYMKRVLQIHIRLSGIDAPEISRIPKTWSAEQRAVELEEALISRDRLSALVHGTVDSKSKSKSIGAAKGVVYIEFHGNDKFGGRWVGTLYQASGFRFRKRGININQVMLDGHYAVPFTGKTKKMSHVGQWCRDVRENM